MEKTNPFKNSQIIILGFSIAAAAVLSTIILSKTLIQMKRFSQEMISVTGSAEQNITSDYAVWRGEFWRRDPLMTSAFAAAKEDLKKVREYLIAKGVRESDIVAAQASTSILYKKNEK